MKFQKILMDVLRTESQAVSIYEAQIFIYKRTAWTLNRIFLLKIFEDILEEEKQHEKKIESFLEIKPIGRSISGFLFGIALSFFPAFLARKIHILAESQASEIYFQAHQKLVDNFEGDFLPKKEEILKILLHASKQEREHSERFTEWQTT